MKMTICLLVGTLIIACNTNKKPDVELIKAECVYELTNSGALDSVIERKNVYRVCDCMKVKAVKKYSTEEEMKKDSEGFREMLFSCIDLTVAEQETR